jgi:MFS transporter, DHA2 family, glioxin efflux transporter
MMGGTYFISAAQSIFGNKLIHHLLVNVPEINPKFVVGLGATQFRDSFPSTVIPGVVLSYMQSLHIVFALATALAGAATVVSLAAKWEKIQVRM